MSELCSIAPDIIPRGARAETPKANVYFGTIQPVTQLQSQYFAYCQATISVLGADCKAGICRLTGGQPVDLYSQPRIVYSVTADVWCPMPIKAEAEAFWQRRLWLRLSVAGEAEISAAH